MLAQRRSVVRRANKLLGGLLVVLCCALLLRPTFSPAVANEGARTEGGTAVDARAANDGVSLVLGWTVQLSAGRSVDGVPVAQEGCSGMLVDESLVLTARHCLRDAHERPWTFFDVWIGVSRDQPAGAAGALPIRHDPICHVGRRAARFLPGSSPEADFGVVSLRSCPAGAVRAGAPTLGAPPELGVGDASVTVGYPGDKATANPLVRLLWRLDRTVSAVGSYPGGGEYLETEGGVAPGWSGSPMLSASAAGWSVAGVLISNRDEVRVGWEGRTSVESSHARYLRVTPAMAAQITSWGTEPRA